MTKLTMAAAVMITMAGFAQADGVADPVIEPLIVAQDATSSSSGTALVAMLAVLMSIPLLD